MKKSTILIVEDENIIARDIENKLKRLGYAVSGVVSSGEEAVGRVEVMPPDLVLMDIMLSGHIDGIEAAEQIRARFNIPVVYLTAYADEDTLGRAKVTEPFGYLLKPFSVKELRGAIEIALYKYQMERKLEESEKRYRQIVEEASDMVFTADLQGHFTYVNPPSQKLSGYSEDELIRRHCTDLIAPAWRGRVRFFYMRQFLKRNRETRLEFPIVTQSGEEKWVEQIATLLADDDRVTGFHAIVRDVTARKRAEEMQREYAERLRILHKVDQAILGAQSLEEIGQTVLHHIRQWVPCQWASIDLYDFETKKGTVLAVDVEGETRLRPGTDVALDGLSEVIEVLRQGVVYAFDDVGSLPQQSSGFPGMRVEGVRSGISIPLLSHGELIGALNLGSNHPGAFNKKQIEIAHEVANSLAVAIQNARLHEQVRSYADALEERVEARTAELAASNKQLQREIADRVKAEAAIKQQKELLQTIFDHIPVMVAFYNSDGGMQWVNRELERTLGWYQEEIERIDLLAECYPDAASRREIRDHLQAASSGWRDFRTRVRKGGTLDTSWAYIRLSDGTSIGIGQDITERKRAAAQILHSSRLAAVGELAAGIAHEILNPVNGIINCAKILIPQFEADAESREFVELIQSEGERIAETIQNLLNYSRQQEAVPRFERLNDIVARTLLLVGMQLQKSNINLRVEVPENLLPLMCRGGQLQQVVMNLLLNARDALNQRYAGADPDKILSVTAARVSHEEQPRPDGWERRSLRLTVEDHGGGIEPDHLPRLFDPFFTTKEPGQGTGLGLSISKEIVESHGGAIDVESEVGAFTRFHVNLPLVYEA